MTQGALPVDLPSPDWLAGPSYPWQDERAALLFQLLTKNVPLPSSILPLARGAGVDLSGLRESRGRETWADVLESAVGPGGKMSALLGAFANRVPAAVPPLLAILRAPHAAGPAAEPLPRARAGTELETREDLRRLVTMRGRAWVAFTTDHASFRDAAVKIGALVEDESALAWALLPEKNDPREGFPEEGPCLVEYDHGDIARRIQLEGRAR